MAPDPNARDFAVQTPGHVVLAGTLDIVTNAALPLWLSAMVNDDEIAWVSETL